MSASAYPPWYELSLGDLEQQEQLVGLLLDDLRPLLEALDALDFDEDDAALQGDNPLRLDAVLRLFAAGVERAQALLPELPPPLGDEPLHRRLSAEERDKLEMVAAMLESDDGAERTCQEAGVDAQFLREALDGYRKADALERVAEGIRVLGAAIDWARARIERRLSATPSARAAAN
jgi:hypothetical protein